ncbi:MAG: glucose-6-phosphate isomerase [Clostridiales bacterium]|jgi:glucose-6-phosphate isomerase|nr:glucose-6-phosphate isomerase [Clostridiales bacterium]
MKAEQMKPIKVDFNNMMSDFIGSKEGIAQRDITLIKPLADEAAAAYKKGRGKGMTGWTELPYNQSEIVADIKKTAGEIIEKFDNFVVLGIGGSALGPFAVFNALCHLRYNDLSKRKRKGPRFFVEDNVDPERMAALLDVVDIGKTVFNVITKSGSTSETMSQYLIISDILKKKLGDKWNQHIIATTDTKNGNLIKLAKDNKFKTFYIPANVGGRFSELCPVGLLPAAVLGIDIEAMLEGAKYIDGVCSESDDVFANAPLMSAALQYISIKKGKNISVMMPYADSLRYMADWYCQLWGESLGKENDLNGQKIYAGQTPVKALGVTDQHSQVQLYTEGPFDKVITLIAVEKYRKTVKIADGCAEYPNVNFLCGHTLNELITNERLATEYALQRAQRLNHTIILPSVNAYTIGQLIMFFQIETAYLGTMLNIDTFNQPGVEEGKNATYALFGRQGYEEKKAEIKASPKKKSKYII